MDFTTITVEILKALSLIAGSYGLAIVLLTVIVRLAMWPLSVSQQRSMRKMQLLSPKLKEIQNRYKKDPQVMQKRMMEFYKEHKFNPFGGCLPLIIQMPIFILLYTALISPQFIEIAGKSSFLFINRLDATIMSHAGKIGDKTFGVEKNDVFSTEKTAVVYTDKGAIKDVKIKNPSKAIEKQGEMVPGKSVDLKIKLDELNLPFSQLAKVQKADISIINNNTKEIEHITFKKSDSLLISNVQTQAVKKVYHYDVMFLIALFGISMFFSQKFMSNMNTAAVDPAQKAMQDQMGKMMPIMITGTFIFVPIPAGVLLYMVVSNIIQVAQTVIINKQLEAEDPSPKASIVDSDAVENAKNITPAKEK
ncbi:MAG: membrane protein insertase YidC [Candidatus Gastranaerophilales bacterium]|nr:membrane protein insertase YidC [Candidatus Gastranaerophilales bacterium]